MVKWFLLGAVTSVLATPVLVVLTALFFRFPVPFAGIMSGTDAIPYIPITVLFYGVYFGGFAVQAVLGGTGGVAGARRGRPDSRTMRKQCLVVSILASELGVLILATLDWIVGAW